MLTAHSTQTTTCIVAVCVGPPSLRLNYLLVQVMLYRSSSNRRCPHQQLSLLQLALVLLLLSTNKFILSQAAYIRGVPPDLFSQNFSSSSSQPSPWSWLPEQSVAGVDVLVTKMRTGDHSTDDFVPLSCNGDIGAAPCRSWISVVGTSAVHSNRVIIDCGTCVVLDIATVIWAFPANATLALLGGLDVRGKLVIKDSNPNCRPSIKTLTIRTTLLVVQGELEMTTTNCKSYVDGKPVITGKDQLFTPIGENLHNLHIF
jgi:hypothetical protein